MDNLLVNLLLKWALASYPVKPKQRLSCIDFISETVVLSPLRLMRPLDFCSTARREKYLSTYLFSDDLIFE